ncbi:RagB/SusD family nutrient uptake outer membrane protein [Sphingobacterium sp. MYb388]|uniref:RagB/SusD family nutrient uptake outer membrane protein n=1 Tax=Sphingobacterium sp. MYb388 TaxID=2745437 RepID=UPI0030A28BD3
MKYNNKYIYACLLFTALFTSCDKLLEIDDPLNEQPSEVVFRSPETAKMALSGAYGQLSLNSTFTFQFTSFNGLAADELLYTSPAQFGDVMTNTYDPITTLGLYSIWGDVYTSIYRFNSIIDGVTGNTLLPVSLTNQMLGEAKTMRAYCYYHLVNMFGDIPLVVSTDANITAMQPRASVSSIYELLISDLEEAKTLLAEDYSSGSRQQVNRGAATALLSRIYLHVEDYPRALSNSSDVISQTGRYSLLPADQLDRVFLQNSSEAILQLGPDLQGDNGYTREGATFLPALATSVPNYALSSSQVSAFEPGDLRADVWVLPWKVNNIDYFLPYKYQNHSQEVAMTNNRQETPMVLRLAEQYLIRAEARMRTGDEDGARSDINIIRNRAGLGNLSSSINLMDAILQERHAELFCELGNRWHTIKRMDRVDDIMGALRPVTWQPFANLYPIPQTARDSNPNLTQNEGYR